MQGGINKPATKKERLKYDLEDTLARIPEYLAIQESSRCLQCYNAPCKHGCPAEVDVTEFVSRIRSKNFIGAAQIIREANILGGTCAYICPTEILCQLECTGKKHSRPLDIGALQRFVMDYEATVGAVKPILPAKTGKTIAVVGSGPSGLTAAYELLKKGHTPLIYESERFTGGMLETCIPTFRLPRTVVRREIQFIKESGIEIKTTSPQYDMAELKEKYDAVFIGIGLGDPIKTTIKTPLLPGIYYFNTLLSDIFIKEVKPDLGNHATVIGGGNAAIDTARTIMRSGCKRVSILYRRSFKDMPSWPGERIEALEEAIDLYPYVIPKKIIGKKRVETIECMRLTPGDRDKTGRSKPIIIPDSEFEIKTDSIIFAIGQKINETFKQANPKIINSKGLIEINKKYQTPLKGIFAGGDVTNGGATVVEAIRDGKDAAKSIDLFLGGI